MANYVIGYDRDGSIFLAHSSERSNYKYFRKVQEGTRTRYFYSEKEWNAYLRNRNRPKTQAEVQKERAAAENAVREASKNLRVTSQNLDWAKKQRDRTKATLKAYEDEHRAKMLRSIKDPNHQMSQTEKWMLEGGIEELRETDKEWDAWVNEGEKILNKQKKVFSDALRTVNWK